MAKKSSAMLLFLLVGIFTSCLDAMSINVHRDDCQSNSNDLDCIGEFSDQAFNVTYDDVKPGSILHIHQGLEYFDFKVIKFFGSNCAQAAQASSLNASMLPTMTATAGAVVFKLKTFYWACSNDNRLAGNCTISVAGYNPSQTGDHGLEFAGGPVNFKYDKAEAAKNSLELATMPPNFIYNSYKFNISSIDDQRSLLLDHLSLVTYYLDESDDG